MALRSFIKRSAPVLAVGLACYLFLELSIFGLVRVTRGYTPALSRLADEFVKMEALKVGGSCTFRDTARLDPYNAYYLSNRKDCYPHGVNVFGSNHGHKGVPYDHDAFNILVVGGSVADMFAHHRPHGSYYFEDYLNRHYLPPAPKKYFKVLNAANAEARQPMQYIKASMNTELFDALVAIEGFNEFLPIYYGDHLFTPPHVYVYQMAGLSEEMGRLARARVVDFAKRNRASLLGQSPLVYTLTSIAFRMTFSLFPARPISQHFTKLQELDHPFVAMGLEEKFQSNVADYQKMLRSLKAVCVEHRKKCILFFQPLSSHLKVLTKEELAFVEKDQQFMRRETFNKGYVRMVDSLQASSSEAFPFVPLLDLFRDIRYSIYDDFVHYIQKEQSPDRPAGNELMAARIAKVLEGKWKLRRKD